MKAVVATFDQEKALVGAFSVIVQLHRLIFYSTVIGAAAPNVFVSVRLSAGSPQPQPPADTNYQPWITQNLYQDHKIFIHRQSLWPENIQLSGNHSINLCHPPTHKNI